MRSSPWHESMSPFSFSFPFSFFVVGLFFFAFLSLILSLSYFPTLLTVLFVPPLLLPYCRCYHYRHQHHYHYVLTSGEGHPSSFPPFLSFFFFLFSFLQLIKHMYVAPPWIIPIEFLLEIFVLPLSRTLLQRHLEITPRTDGSRQ